MKALDKNNMQEVNGGWVILGPIVLGLAMAAANKAEAERIERYNNRYN